MQLHKVPLWLPVQVAPEEQRTEVVRVGEAQAHEGPGCPAAPIDGDQYRHSEEGDIDEGPSPLGPFLEEENDIQFRGHEFR